MGKRRSKLQERREVASFGYIEKGGMKGKRKIEKKKTKIVEDR